MKLKVTTVDWKIMIEAGELDMISLIKNWVGMNYTAVTGVVHCQLAKEDQLLLIIYLAQGKIS